MEIVKCPLCEENFKKEDLKTNTHYLTDGIIRSALNMDGSKGRGEGFYFEISTDSPYIEANFQQITSAEKLKRELGREVTEIEIEKSKSTIVFSVNYVFCKGCEDKFTNIETKFQNIILPKLRKKGGLNGISELTLENSNLIRIFFLLQIWRTNICDTIFKLPNKVSQELRHIIWEYATSEVEISKKHPLIINYLETLGEDIEFTKNVVGYSNDKNPFPIWMNDFVIQFYESKEALIYSDFYGLNSKENFQNEVNVHEKFFKINIKSNQFRDSFNGKLHKENVKIKLDQYKSYFKHIWNKIFKTYPSQNIINEYLGPLTFSNSNIYQIYTEENLKNYTLKFLEYYMANHPSYSRIYHKFLSEKFDEFNKNK